MRYERVTEPRQEMPDQLLINKKKRTFSLVFFDVPVDQNENERKQNVKQILESSQRDENAVKNQVDSDSNRFFWIF